MLVTFHKIKPIPHIDSRAGFTRFLRRDVLLPNDDFRDIVRICTLRGNRYSVSEVQLCYTCTKIDQNYLLFH